MFIASDIPAILGHTRDMIFLEDRQLAVVTREGVAVTTLAGEPVDAGVHTIPWDPVAAAKGRIPPLHAEGDLRAGPLGHRHHPRAGRFRGRARCAWRTWS